MKYGKVIFGALLATGLFLVDEGCGPNQPPVISNFTYTVGKDTAGVAITFDPSLTLNSAFTVPIEAYGTNNPTQYGSITMQPGANGQGVSLGASLNLAALVDPDFINLSETQALPNGQPMPNYVTSQVARLYIKASPQVATDLYLGLDPNNFYLGVAIELSFIDAQFPAGLVISQWLRDSKSRPIGVITLYGPEVANGQMTAPGGLFFITNVTQLEAYAKADKGTATATSTSTETVTSPAAQILSLGHSNDASALIGGGLTSILKTEVNQSSYQNQDKINKLLQQFQKRAKSAGMAN